MTTEPAHDATARECVIVGAPLSMLHDGPCPACRAMSALIDLDPDFGSAEDGRPDLRTSPEPVAATRDEGVCTWDGREESEQSSCTCPVLGDDTILEAPVDEEGLADPFVPGADDASNLGLLIFTDATPGGTDRIIKRILASEWMRNHIAAAEKRGAARGLLEAADAWQVGEWSNVLLPKPTPPAVPVIAYSNRILDWLRARAAEVGAQ